MAVIRKRYTELLLLREHPVCTPAFVNRILEKDVTRWVTSFQAI